MSSVAEAPEPTEIKLSKVGISCLRFPSDVQWLMQSVPSCKYKTLREIFHPLLNVSEHDLLDQPARPRECQMRMTMFLIKKKHHLLEAAQDNQEMMQVLLAAADRCPDFNYKGARND